MIPAGTCVSVLDGEDVTVTRMVCRTYLADSPVFECTDPNGNIVYVPMYDMKTEQGEAYRETAKKMLKGHRRLLGDIACVETIKECVCDFIPSVEHRFVGDMHYIYSGIRVMGSGNNEQEAWLSVLDNIL